MPGMTQKAAHLPKKARGPSIDERTSLLESRIASQDNTQAVTADFIGGMRGSLARRGMPSQLREGPGSEVPPSPT